MHISYELAGAKFQNNEQDKLQFATQFCRFVTGNFLKRDFPNWFRKQLSVVFGFNSSDSQSEFYNCFFIDHTPMLFLRQCYTYDGSEKFRDVAHCLQNWMSANVILSQIHNGQSPAKEDDFPEYNGDLGDTCIRLGADPAAVGGWPDFKRRSFIENYFSKEDYV